MIAWLVLAALGLHSLIPVGYMPDFSGHGLLVMCDGVDHMAGLAGEMPDCPHHKKACPFSVASIDGFKGLHVPVIMPSVYGVLADFSFVSLRLVPFTDFSNASPRSPPYFS